MKCSLFAGTRFVSGSADAGRGEIGRACRQSASRIPEFFLASSAASYGRQWRTPVDPSSVAVQAPSTTEEARREKACIEGANRDSQPRAAQSIDGCHGVDHCQATDETALADWSSCYIAFHYLDITCRGPRPPVRITCAEPPGLPAQLKGNQLWLPPGPLLRSRGTVIFHPNSRSSLAQRLSRSMFPPILRAQNSLFVWGMLARRQAL